MSELAKQQGSLYLFMAQTPLNHLEKYFAHGADYVIFGECEQTLAEILDHILREKGLRESINGLAYIEME